jgi:hypothetical protein
MYGPQYQCNHYPESIDRNKMCSTYDDCDGMINAGILYVNSFSGGSIDQLINNRCSSRFTNVFFMSASCVS